MNFYLSDDGTTPGQLLRDRSIFRLRAGESKTLVFSSSRRVVLPGKYIIAVIDANSQVVETNEANNRAVIVVP